MPAHSVRVDNGKYTFTIEGSYYRIDRHGGPWIIAERVGNSAIHAMMCELDAARVVVAAVRSVLERSMPLDTRNVLEEAIKTHLSLVSDHESPSEWAR